MDRAHTMGLTARDIAQQLADTPDDDESTWADPDLSARPACWRAFGEPAEEQQ